MMVRSQFMNLTMIGYKMNLKLTSQEVAKAIELYINDKFKLKPTSDSKFELYSYYDDNNNFVGGVEVTNCETTEGEKDNGKVETS